MTKEKTRRELHVWHYLHDSSQGRTKAERITDGEITLTLPVVGGGRGAYVLPVDVRDMRALVAVDGDLVWGGIPHSATVLSSVELGELRVEAINARKSRLAEERPRYQSQKRGFREYVVLNLKRHFLLLAQSRSVVRRYRADSLSPQYLFIEVDHGKVYWRTTTS